MQQHRRYGEAPVKDDIVGGLRSSSGPEFVATDPVYFVGARPKQERVPILDQHGKTAGVVSAQDGLLEFELRWTGPGWGVAKIRSVNTK